MTMLSKNIDGIVTCALGIVLEGFSLNAIIPIFAGVLSKDIKFKSDEDMFMQCMLWFMIWVISSVLIFIGKSQIRGTANIEKNNSILHREVMEQKALHAANIENNNSILHPHNSKPNTSWYCPKCGKLNHNPVSSDNYVGTCSCGQLQPK